VTPIHICTPVVYRYNDLADDTKKIPMIIVKQTTRHFLDTYIAWLDFGFEHGKKYPAGWVGDPDDCSKKYADDGFEGKDSVLPKEFAQCIVGYNTGSSLPQSEHDEIVVYDNKDMAHFVHSRK
jgi:hypothetical protein